MGLVVAHGLRLALAGLAIGLIGAFAATRWMSSMLYEVGPTDPATLALVGSACLAVVVAACLVPARRSARIDPFVALRQE